MLKIFGMAAAVSLTLCTSVFCEDTVIIPRGFSFGIGFGQQDGDVAVSLNATSPYMHFKRCPRPRTFGAVRIHGVYRIKNAVSAGATADSLMSYYAARIGFVGSDEVTDAIRVYEEVGCVSVFPTSAMASNKKPGVGIYGNIGGEIMIGKNVVTRNTGVYMEIGIASFLSEQRFDKLANSPLMGFGATVGGGARFYL
jgi:hypothetical protein